MTQYSHQQHKLPAGCHDANTASDLLGVSKKALLKRMREAGWLMVGGDNQNLPRRDFVQRGWLTTQDRGYPLKGRHEIFKSYRVMLLTQRGFQELKKLMDADTNPEAAEPKQPSPKPEQKAPHEPPATKPMTPAERAAADAERRKALDQLKQWGLTG